MSDLPVTGAVRTPEVAARGQAIATGRPYQTRLHPSPADARVAHPLRTMAAAP